MKCLECAITIPDMPEDATREEKTCDRCHARIELEWQDKFEEFLTIKGE